MSTTGTVLCDNTGLALLPERPVAFIPTAKRGGGKGLGAFVDHNNAVAWLKRTDSVKEETKKKYLKLIGTDLGAPPGVGSCRDAGIYCDGYHSVILPKFSRTYAEHLAILNGAPAKKAKTSRLLKLRGPPLRIPSDVKTVRDCYVATLRRKHQPEVRVEDPKDLIAMLKENGVENPRWYMPARLDSNGVTLHLSLQVDPKIVSYYRENTLELKRSLTVDTIIPGSPSREKARKLG